MNLKFDDNFTSFHVCDSDGNQVNPPGSVEHPDDAYRELLNALARVRNDWEPLRIVGTLAGDEGACVTLLTAYRDGPPGSTRIKLLHPTFPWLTVEVPS